MADKDKLTYWELRSALEEQKLFKRGDEYERKVINVYNQARQYLTNAVDELYKRYDGQTSLTEAQAKAALNNTVPAADLVALQNAVKTIDDKETKIKVQEYLDWVAAKSRITKMEELKAKAYIVAKQLADVQLEQSTDYYVNAVRDAYASASREAIIGNAQAKAGVYQGETVPMVNHKTNQIEFVKPEKTTPIKAENADAFSELSTKEVKQILDKPWLGSNYSKRIWNDTDLLAKKLQELFAVSEMTGMSQREMAERIAKEFNTGIGVARRLIRTEANHVHNQAKLAGWKAHGVEKYSLVAVLDFRTSQKCRDIDGKVFDVDKAIVNVNFPPLHPWCRTVAVAWFSYAKYGGNRTANDPITGETFKLNADDTYRDWEQMLIDKHGEKAVNQQSEKSSKYSTDSKQYAAVKELIDEENMPTFEKFQDLKYNDGKKWQNLHMDYLRRRRLLNEPSLTLPNLDNLFIPKEKITKYLFDKTNKNGYPKGKIITQKLGIGIDNYQELIDIIAQSADKFPAIMKEDLGYGPRYQQDIIVYSKHKEPVNMRVAWIDQQGTTRMTSAFIRGLRNED